ncbi:hypothetical protein D7X55_04975 [Corallococcus sp. AB049A]|uniref:Uncharacterized protein n=1 Tax=Corallococcus interemptor TaxID=2316720 RepID=A0A3A8Q5R4_9BACT|nr:MULTISPECIES: hypothetical protein [Corallococcus]RKH54015.1 hypothetical protein D7Y23_01565 [Corallococcus sp. AB050B]RKH64027.1 hypothetical protein D7X96_26595 [Corallococcus interemptor]RKI73630.1 hypothetical protein D7X55_04975 [Corallococcus sp. AB049A]
MRLNLLPVIGLLCLSACDSKSEQTEGAGSLKGDKAFPVSWSGELLPRSPDGGTSFTIALLSDSDFSGLCTTPADAGYVLPPSRFVMVSVLGPPAEGTFEVGSETGPGFVQVQQRLADGETETLAVATSGSIQLTTATTDRLVGSFEVQVRGKSDGMTTELSGTFDAPFCANRK